VETVTGMLRAHVYVEPAPLPALPEVPVKVADLCRSCLRKDPADRPSAREVAAVLARAAGIRIVDDELAHSLAPPPVDGEPSSVLVPRPASGVGIPGPSRRRRALILATAATAVAVAVAGTVFWFADPTGSGLGRRAAEPSLTGQPSVDGEPPATAPDATSGAPSAPAGPNTPIIGVPVGPAGASGPGATGAVPTGQPGGVPLDASPTPPTSTPPTSPDPPPAVEETLSSDGGSVRATCTSGGDAWLLSWTATRPYRVEQVDPGPSQTTTAAFRHGNRTVRMTITCTDGVPSTSNSTSE
jgi:serine/threonine-protein kinase